MRTEATDPDPRPGEHDTDTAWKTLSLVDDWIKHAETKAAATLAATGVATGILYNLTNDLKSWPWPTSTAVALCVAALLSAGVCAAIALRPRLKNGAPGHNIFFYADIAHRYPQDLGCDNYVAAFQELTSNRATTISQVAAQVWANAHVATKKYTWVRRAINALLGALVLLALAIVLIRVHE